MNATIGLTVGYVPHLPREYFDTRPWVARILGKDPVFGMVREFVPGSNDYSQADKKGRGIKRWFVLQPGIYEVREPHHNRPTDRRWFVEVLEDGVLKSIQEDEVKKSLRFVWREQSDRTVLTRFALLAFKEGVQIVATKTPTRWWAVMAGDEPVAVYGLMISPRHPSRARLKGVFVMPRHRGKGIGGEMLDDAMRRASSLGIKTLEALVYKPKAYLERGWTEMRGPRSTKFGQVHMVRWHHEG